MLSGRHQGGAQAARVSCTSCGRQWFGATVAEGLAVLGHCPRCGGEIAFAPEQAAGAAGDRRSELIAAGVQPWQVLGRPTSWDCGH